MAALDEMPVPDSVGVLLDTTDDLWRRLLQYVSDDRLDVREQDGEAVLRAVSPRLTIATVGENQSAGGAGYALLLWDAHPGLTYAGLDITIADASGDDADALARPTPEAEQHAPALVERLTGGEEARVESESSTGRTKAGMTARHVLQAAAEGRRAIVLTRPDDAPNVADTLLAEPPFCRSDSVEDGETRYYTSPRDLRIGGEALTRPGSRSNVWVREASGEVVLRDDVGTEHARFPDVAAAFSDADAYPGGERTVKRPSSPRRCSTASTPSPTQR
ncbi:hypothetical protein ACFO0N_01145 [Halobium salinum]|uniref:Uncharacterized protein n=1 Tax=Halobium salinum TaxID=1364940 RepID=A0ABD5P6S2_9EURY|nr:hypothetical protein [Halobium salinum]